MIIARSPFRLDLGGGPTDVPSFYQKHGGNLVSASIDKYVYVTVSRPMNGFGYIVKCLESTAADDIQSINHPIVRECMKEVRIDPPLEITSVSDIPGGTGLGSSGSFTTALLKALYAFSGRSIGGEALAELAFDIEVNRLNRPIGKQDQYAAVFGGVLFQEYGINGRVRVTAVRLDGKTQFDLRYNLLLFYTRQVRRVQDVMSYQREKSEQNDSVMEQNLIQCKRLGVAVRSVLENGDMDTFGKLLTGKHDNQKARWVGMTNARIEAAYQAGIRSGAEGGMLVGAGGGGFLLFYTKSPEKLREAMRFQEMPEVEFGFDFEGTKLL